jgi:Ca2+-binding RTX toxin-like protein
MATIKGSIFSDSGMFAIEGTPDDDVIYAYGGHDDVYGNDGDDTVYGDEGNDSLYGGDGDDTLYGGETQDFLYGGDGNDILVGGSGSLFADDVMEGGRGNDSYYVNEARDVVTEVAGASDGIDHVRSSISYTLTARVEHLTLLQGAGAINGTGNELDNEITGNSSSNTLTGLDGSDTLDGGGGADTMRGGTGHDFYFVDNSNDVVTENADEGIDTVNSAVSFTLGANVEHLNLMAGFGALAGTGNTLDNNIIGNESANEIRGNDGEDLLKGGGGADVLRGGNQNDELYGESGDDDLRGDSGDDEMYGGTDNDTYSVNSVGDRVIEFANQGTDTVNSSLDAYTLTDDVENLNLSTGINGTGNGLGNRIIGNILDNVLDGAGGADTMEGRQGNDTFRVDNASDAVIELADQGNDTVLASVSYTLGAGVSVETLATTNDSGTAAINLTGNGIGNSIRGNNGSNVLNGGGGSDGLDGRGGTDTVSYENNAWRVVVVLGVGGAPGQGYEFGLVPQEVLLSVDTLVNIENVRGSSFNDTLVGNDANNELRGGLGGDTYVVQNAGDAIVESGGQGVDEVRSSVSYTLTAGADVETLRTTDDNGTAAINLTGNASGNHVVGNNGSNTLNGGGGNGDELEGRGGDDTYVVSNANVAITESGGQGTDTAVSSVSYTLTAGADVENLRTSNDAGTAAINLTGNNTGNIVTGNNGNNILNGAGGDDDLIGRGGQDQFLFNTALDAANNVDRILDFNVADDTILLEQDIFSSSLGLGNISAGEFVIGTAAQDANDRIIYNNANGALFYDSDGAGGVAAIQFAELTPGLALTNLDFLVV